MRAVAAPERDTSDFEPLWRGARSLTALRGMEYDAFWTMIELLQELSATEPDRDRLSDALRRLTLQLVEWSELTADSPPGNLWQQFLVHKILSGDHLLGRRAAVMPRLKIGRSLMQMARADLAALRHLYDLSSTALQQTLSRARVSEIPLWDNGLSDRSRDLPDPIVQMFHNSRSWEPLLEPLADYFFHHGAGSGAGFKAFRWDTSEGLIGIARPDAITLEDLVGCDYQKAALIRNTEQFLAGYPCNNILLYGARGTGKSSLVKALLNAYGDRGLRLVEVAREDMRQFPAIVRQLRGRPQRFLLFADDLSYDDSELHYRELKAALEGSVEGRPENVLLYATSNRRHLIKERFRDRESADDEIHAHDTAQEKLSLADRFGLTLSFPPPSQADYLRMVESIAARRGLAVPREELHAAAIRWAALHNVPSGRTARQFIDDLQGAILRDRTPGRQD